MNMRKEALMVFLDKRIRVICDELKKLSIVQKVPVEDWKYKKGNFIVPADADAATDEWKQFDCRSMHWYGPDEHYWFRGAFTVTEDMAGKAVWMNVRTQIDEWDDGKNPQFLLYVDDVETQGIDMNHRQVLLTGEAVSGHTYHLDLQSYTGTLHSEFNLIIEMLVIDPKIERLYYDLSVPLSAFSRMEKDDKIRYDIETVLNNCINRLDLRTPYSREFYLALEEATDYLKKALYEDMAGYEDVIATCIGHTHIDVAWWWTVEQTREKVGRSFATVLKLMEEYPNYKFMSSQPQLYYFLKERYPKLYARLKERVKEGRWEPEGGMWVEADCNLTSGESLVRQFIHGKKFFKEEFGVDNKILWLPDVFGYSGALPQIMKKCGIDYFMTTKLAWNQFNKMPYDTLYWKGIDGTRILVSVRAQMTSLLPIMACFIRILSWVAGPGIRIKKLIMTS
jgi:alpha-mannosidase